MKLSFFCALTLLSSAATATASGLRGKSRNLEYCGAYGICNERSICTNKGCVCKDGFKNPPFCEDCNECLELDPRPCQFDGATCVDMDPNLDDSIGGMYKCVCRTKEGWMDGPEFNDFGPTTCKYVPNSPCLEYPCHPSATCIDEGSAAFSCSCNGNLIGDGVTNCDPPEPPPEEIDPGQCSSDDDCRVSPFRTCNAVMKKCLCIEGYFQPSGAGGTCQPRNFCHKNNHDCDQKFGACIPLLGDAPSGFFTCKCASGYTTKEGYLTGRKCVPHDQCSDGSHDCEEDEDCMDLQLPLTFECIPKEVEPIDPEPEEENETITTPPPALPCTTFNCGSGAFCAAKLNACVCLPGHSGNPNSICLDDHRITPNTFVWSNTNGAFTVDRNYGIELGLRAKVRYDYRNRPKGEGDVIPFDGEHTYTFHMGLPPDDAKANHSRWNLDWTINSDYDAIDSSGKKIKDYKYRFILDADPGPGITPVELLDRISADKRGHWHRIGNNTTPQGGGVSAEGN